MANSCSWRHNAKVIKCVLAPLKECIALHIAFIFTVDIGLKGTWCPKGINHNRVIDDQVHRIKRVDFLSIATKRDNAIAHCRQINNGWNASEVLHQNPGRPIGDLTRVFSTFCAPLRKCANIIYRDCSAVFESKHVFQHHL